MSKEILLSALLIATIGEQPIGVQKDQIGEFASDVLGEQVVVEEVFNGPMDLKGAVVSGGNGREPFVIYVDENRQHLFAGAIFDRTGKNITLSHLPDSGSNSLQVENQQIVELLTALSTIDEGEPAAPLLYVFVDPNCPICATFHNNLSGHIARGEIRVRWLVSNILGQDGKAESIYDSASNDEAVDAIHRLYKSDFTPSVSSITQSSVARVEEINQFMRSQRIQGTPSMIYADRQGTIHKYQGMPAADRLRQIVLTASPSLEQPPEIADSQGNENE